MKRKILIGLIIVFLIILCSANISISKFEKRYLGPDLEKIEKKLQTQDKVRVIVRLKEEFLKLQTLNVKEKKKTIRRIEEGVLSKLNVIDWKEIRREKKNKSETSAPENKKVDFYLKYKYSLTPAFAGYVTKEGLEKLKDDPNVEVVYFDRPLHILLFESVPLINATEVWKKQFNGINLTGKGQTICVIDTGVNYTHAALNSSYLGGYDFVNMDDDPMDDNGHGTHVVGIITSDNETYKGAAPDAGIVVVKACDSSGRCSETAKGIEWCIDNAHIYNISVISISLGGNTTYSSYCDSPPPFIPFEQTYINEAVRKNISVIVASGNNGWEDGVTFPACFQNATPVGSVNDGSEGITADEISSFSNRWSLPMIFAPGSKIISTQMRGGFPSTGGSGTSYAAPHVSAVVALMYQSAELMGVSLTPQEVEDILISTGVDIAENQKRTNALAAINYIENLQPETISITFEGENIAFGELGPGIETPAPENPYKLIIESSQPVDVYQKGTDFSTASNSFSIENMKWAETLEGQKIPLSKNYIKILDSKTSGSYDMYYWLTVPFSAPQDTNYISDITITAVLENTGPPSGDGGGSGSQAPIQTITQITQTKEQIHETTQETKPQGGASVNIIKLN